MLEYHNAILQDIVNENGLVVMAKGLGLSKILAMLLQLYCTTCTSVFLINASSEQMVQLNNLLLSLGLYENQLPTIIDAKTLTAERKVLYQNGGCFFITARIFIVDILNERVNLEKVHGLLIHHAEEIKEAGVPAFIVRVYRERNKIGFVKAFTENAAKLSTGFRSLERLLKVLYLRKVFLYPRFHEVVQKSLQNASPNVIEIEEPLTELMQVIQDCILLAMESCLKELKACTKGLDASNFSVKQALMKAMDIAIRRQLDPIWHTLSGKTKQLVEDLQMLRKLMGYLTKYDAISFYSILNTVKVVSSQQQRTPTMWLYTEAADRMFKAAKARLYIVQGKGSPEASAKLILESNPKCEALLDVLQTLQEDLNDIPGERQNVLGGVDVLILTQEERTNALLRSCLTLGCKQTMVKRLKNYVARSIQQSRLDKPTLEHQMLLKHFKDIRATTTVKRKRPPAKRKSSTQDEQTQIPLSIGLTPKELEELTAFDDEIAIDEPEFGVDNISCKMMSEFQYMIATYDEIFKMPNVLANLMPRCVIMYDPSVRFVRQLEAFHAEHDSKLLVYFVTYENSGEQQVYLNELQKEKSSFEKLIHDKAHMMFTSELYPSIDEGKPKLSMDTRTTSKPPIEEAKLIVVDVREFRSALPSMLHSSGLKLRSETLEVADFVLSPQICIERKSISDLYGSFRSGRLYQQAEQMRRHYETPILLIEFSEGKAFSLQDPSQIYEDISENSITSKVALFVLHFPSLRLLWSRSPNMTVQLFKNLKKGQPDPSVEDAVNVGNRLTDDSENGIDESKMHSLDLLAKLPGVNQHNIRKVIKNVKNLIELSNMSLPELSELLGATNSKQLHTFLHKQV